ncbi:hypothetical protein FQR65_LT14924 [Abscondita terminalis]|nr:hypothetical protein FQR65_LT14924 [Abscondita terminalis]
MNITKLFVIRSKIAKYVSRHFYDCYPPCPTPKPLTVTVTGVNSRVGQITALVLKQCQYIDQLNVFDYTEGPYGTSVDLSHIDTNTKISGFTGLDCLKEAITDADVVVICGGESDKPLQNDRDLFKKNADYVRNIALHTSEFNSSSIICVSTPPVAAMVPLISEEYKKAEVYNARKIIGITTLGQSRANSIIGEYTQNDPSSIQCPIVGADRMTTIVPVLSQTKIGVKLPKPAQELLYNQICTAEDDALIKKYTENSGPCIISSAYSASKFVISVVRGLLDIFYGVECAYVRQIGQAGVFLPYMTSIIKLGSQGVQSIHMPHINEAECERLQKVAKTIRKQIKWGESYITGELLEKKRRTKRPQHTCEVIKIDRLSKIGDANYNKTP